MSPTEMIHRHTAVQFEGADDAFNERLLRQTEANVGPASFITTDDAITAERVQAGVGCSNLLGEQQPRVDRPQ